MTFSLGFCAASWNGIFMAEVAEATAGCALVAFLGHLSGPLTFSLLVSSFGNYQWPLAIFGAQLLANALVTGAVPARRRVGWRGSST